MDPYNVADYWIPEYFRTDVTLVRFYQGALGIFFTFIVKVLKKKLDYL